MDDIRTRIDACAAAVITLNRPERRSAVTLAMWRELRRLCTDRGGG